MSTMYVYVLHINEKEWNFYLCFIYVYIGSIHTYVCMYVSIHKCKYLILKPKFKFTILFVYPVFFALNVKDTERKEKLVFNR